MQDKINEILDYTKAKLEEIDSTAECQALRVDVLGKSGKITALFRFMKEVPPAEKGKVGQMLNNGKIEAERLISAKETFLEQAELEKEINSAEKIDITLPIKGCKGSLHPRTIIQKQIEDVFVSMGFVVEDGNEVETEYNNFIAVNVPENHPARDMQDTFWLNNGQVLKTHTSAAQNRILKKYTPPIRAVFPGRCFRNEDVDASHENTFFQLEGVIVDKDVSVGNLIYFMKEMLSKIFKKEVEVRLRPGFFPFTEPSFEMDVRCPFCDGKGCPTCKNGGWIELCPCGMIHPNVLRHGGIDPEQYSGCAFGLGLDRMVMLSLGIHDIRELNSGNLKLLSQFKLDI
ncbi:MAG: phenylalanine--tRNA ligase subunit alpha [Clostridiales bacterium]|nr:phenylalanine--tRNA ligase subunit alpha [Clostridiales bacterium]